MSDNILVPAPLQYEPVANEDLLKFNDCAKTCKVKGDPEQLAKDWVSKLNDAIKSQNVDKVLRYFADDVAIWRDMLALQWEIRSFEDDKIRPFLEENLKESGMKNVEVSYECAPTVVSPFDNLEWLQVFISFDTAVGKAKGVLRLVQQTEEKSELKLFTIMSALDQIKGHEEKLGHNRPKGVDHGQHEEQTSYLSQRAYETGYKNHSPQVVVVGGGQAGLTVAARLKMMGVDALIVEKNKNIGDNWRNRYKFLVLHDPVWYDHLPYIIPGYLANLHSKR